MTAAFGLPRWLRLRPTGDARTACARQRRHFAGASLVVRVYYAATLYLVAVQLPQWRPWSTAPLLVPPWPVAWIEVVGTGVGVNLVMGGTLLATLVGALAPESRPVRLAVALGLLELVALDYSFGRIGSGWTAWLWAAFLFTLLPDTRGAAGRAARQRYLSVFWAAQVMLFGSFALSGTWKLVFAAVQLGLGEVTAFAPSALARHVAQQLVYSGRDSLLGPTLIAHPLLGWLPFLAIVGLQLAALPAAFQPALHRLWAVALIAFHLATTLLLAMSFPRSILLLALLGAGSPFAPAAVRWADVARALPLVGQRPPERGAAPRAPAPIRRP